MKITKLVGPHNKKLKTKVRFTEVHKAVKTGIALTAYVRKHGHLGLAANQAGILERVCVARIGEKIQIFIDPHVVMQSPRTVNSRERCVSYLNMVGYIKRAPKIVIKWKSVKDWQITDEMKDFEGQDAIILQHLIDHLNGRICIDQMKNIKKLEQ